MKGEETEGREGRGGFFFQFNTQKSSKRHEGVYFCKIKNDELNPAEKLKLLQNENEYFEDSL